MKRTILVLSLLLLATLSQSQIVTRVYIVDSAGAVIHSPLENGAVLDVKELPTKGYNIYADVSPRPYKVVFQMDAEAKRTEYGRPYALNGDNITRPIALGAHRVSIVPYVNSSTPANAGVVLNFTITTPPVLTGRVSIDRPISLVGDTVRLSMVAFDTANGRFIDTLESARFLIDQYGTSILILDKPYWWGWRAPAAGLHVVYGEGRDIYGRTFKTPPETLITVTKEMVDSAYFVKRGWNGHGIEAIITGFGK